MTDAAQLNNTPNTPQIDAVLPACTMPLASIDLLGSGLGPIGQHLPYVTVDDEPALVLMSRPERITLRVPANSTTGAIEIKTPIGHSNMVPLRVARELANGLHPITSPVVSPSGMIFTTVSGPRGKMMPISIVRVSPDGRATPFVTEIMNASGLAFNPQGDLFCSSRTEGIVYAIDPAGQHSIYVEGMGIATGIAFNSEGDLFVGDRSGTIFRIDQNQQTFVHATLEPSVAAYHLVVTNDDELLVTAPTLSSNEPIWRIDRSGDKHIFAKNLGRPQGLALDSDANLYVAASIRGQRGIVRISPDGKEHELVLSGVNLIGIAFSPLGTAILTTNQALFEIDLGVEALRIF